MAEKSIPVSVIMPVYNAGVYLKPALESLLEQTLKEIEIIAVDDGSTDGSGQLLAEYAARDKRLKVISLKRSGAAAPATAALKPHAANGCGLPTPTTLPPPVWRKKCTAGEKRPTATW